MRKEFNTTTITGKFIKQLVATTPVPIVSIWEPGQFVVADLCYVSKDYILRARHNGNPDSYDDVWEDNATHSEDYYFDKIEPYVFGRDYSNITTKYISNSVDYDATTHYYLGEYLRTLKAIYGIDLLPFYNCFSGRYLNSITFSQTAPSKSSYEVKSVADSGYKVALVPAKYGKTYTIGLNNPCRTEIVPCFFSGTKLLSQSTNALKQSIDGDLYKAVYNTDVTKPFTYTTPSWKSIITASDVPIGQFEHDFAILIKIPSSISTAITVVEGDVLNTFDGVNTASNQYVKSVVRNFYPEGAVEKYSTQFLSPLSLFQYSDSKSSAFSNRLVEYLLLNVISSADEITDNIKRVQETVSKLPYSHYAVKGATPGVWSQELQEFIYNFVINNSKATLPLDRNGFVDKDTEGILN